MEKQKKVDENKKGVKMDRLKDSEISKERNNVVKDRSKRND